MFGLTFDQWLEIAQMALLAMGGVWGLFLYRTTRRGQAKLGIEADFRLRKDLVPGTSLLIARLTISNSSNVLWRNEETVATLFDASKISRSGNVRLVPFARADPFLPVYGVETENVGAIEEGRPFAYTEEQQVMLEPGEQVVTELAFPLETERLGLMALKIRATGYQRNRANTPYEWGALVYVDPGRLETGPN